MILPVNEYGNILYDTASKQLLSKLQIIQNKCLKVVHNLPRLTPSADTHKLSSMKPLNYRRKFNLLVHAYGRARNPTYLDDRRLTTRTSATKALKCPKGKSKHLQSSVCYRTSVAWNALTPLVRDTLTIGSFKRCLPKLKTLSNLDWTVTNALLNED